MTRPRIVSVALLVLGGACVAIGVYLVLGLGAALIVLGGMLISADFLVPG